MEMTLRNPNAEPLYRLAIEIAPGYPIFVAPLAYGLFLYSVWRLERLSFELLIAGTGIAFLIIVLLTSATLGWYMWVVPFLALHQQSFGRRGVILVAKKPARVALDYIAPGLQPGSVILLDDFFAYRGSETKGVARAFKEFGKANPKFQFRRLLDYGYGGQGFILAASE